MWAAEDEDAETILTGDEDDAGGLGKKELVYGLIAAVSAGKSKPCEAAYNDSENHIPLDSSPLYRLLVILLDANLLLTVLLR